MTILPELIKIAVYFSFIFLLWQAGNQFCRLVLNAASAPPLPPTSEKEPPETDQPAGRQTGQHTIAAGRVIGVLERILIFLGVIFGRWEIIAGVVALKTVARYKELDDQLNAEYFLIGSLASIFWAALTAFAFVMFDFYAGYKFVPEMQSLFGAG